jgi:hypothetical protein
MVSPGVLVIDLAALTATFFDWDGAAFIKTAPIAVP